MKKSFLFVAIMLSVVGMSGCASIDNRLEREFAKVRKGPAGAPYRSITNFSDALQCMDAKMLAKGVKGIPIMVEDIEDKTEAVKTGTRDMLISAISEMTANSKGIKLIAYGKDAGNLISFMKAANYKDSYKKMPLYDIQGSISQFDKGIASADGSAGLFYRKKGGAGAAHGSSLNVVALDLNVLNTADMSVVSGVTSKNSVAILQRSNSLDMDASISKMGVYFDLNLNTSDGQAQAVRNLVELAAIELVGKLTELPYTDCLGIKPAKTTFISQAPAAPKLLPKTKTSQPPVTKKTKQKIVVSQNRVTPTLSKTAIPKVTKIAHKTTDKKSVTVKPAVLLVPTKAKENTSRQPVVTLASSTKALNNLSNIVRVKRIIKTEVIEEGKPAD